MELHRNDVSQDARPSVWIFEGKSVLLLVGSVAAGVAIFQAVSEIGVELVPAAAMASAPPLAAAAVVALCVNGKPPSYFSDLLKWQGFRLKTWLYSIGALDRPPQLWCPGPVVPHPTAFGKGEL
jgi:hypothetical protein